MTGLEDIGIAILAGGEGSRMGGAKPLVRLGGQSLIERSHAMARGWSDHVVAVVRSTDQLDGLDLPFIGDEPGIEGPLAGLAAALRWSRGGGRQGLLLMACDMPFLPGDLPSRLAGGIGDHRAAVAASGGQLYPVCSLWRNEAVEEIDAYRQSGQNSLRGFAHHLGFATVEWPAGDRDPFFNINSPADLSTAEAMIGG